ncbi:MAG: hypothetical protein WAW85_14655 [Gordonia sp. (in: high G+C Gram-positive bacteria)]|uniref:hypothetical protein n=1 Tax=Gordonia sp. (in: high G+C Gram-positive bacteria) TaxID=84139 RepID=UPI003BB6FAFD
MEYRTQLESLTTLSSDEITLACRGERINALVTHCYDEYLELRELAEEARGGATSERHDFYMQEAAAWRDTARILREMSAASAATETSARTA